MEVVNSFFSNIRDKLANPFFGTLILVLLIHHWELWYTLLNFDDGFTLDRKVGYIQKYISENLTFFNLLWDIGQAALYMVLGYLIVVVTRSLVLWIEYGIMPWVTGKIVNKNVVRKSDYDDVVKEREQYFDQYEEQRENVRKFSKAIDEQTEQIKEKDKNLLDQSNKITKTVHELNETNFKLENSQEKFREATKKIEQLSNINQEQEKNLQDTIQRLRRFQDLFLGKENEEFYYSSIDKFPPEVLKKVKELKSKGKWELFLAVARFYEQGGSIGGEAVTEMINLDLVFDRDSREELKPVGKIIWKYRKVLDDTVLYDIY